MGFARPRVVLAVYASLWACEDVDIGVALGALDEVQQLVGDLEAALLVEARARGATWADIARWSGRRSRQAAHARAQRLLSVRPPL